MNTVYPTAVPNYTIQFSLVNDQTIWALNWKDTGIVAFTKSLDAGNTWTQVPNVTMIGGSYFDVPDFHAVTENIAYLAANHQTDTGKGRIFKTTDGGSTWVLMKQFDTLCSFVHFWDQNTGIMVGYPDMMPGGSQKIQIFKTIDGGITWIPKGGALLANSISGRMPRYINDDLNDSFWFGTNAGEIIKTDDKGDKWAVVKTNYDTSAYESGYSLGYFVITDFNTAFYTNYNTGKLYKTTDGFITEQYVGDPGLGAATYLEKIPGTNILLATAGRSANVLPTVDGSKYSIDNGVTWISLGNIGRMRVKSNGMNATFAHGWDGTGGFLDYFKIVKLTGDLKAGELPGTTPSSPDVIFEIYPIPAGETLYFNTDGSEVQYTIWDSAGRLIAKDNTYLAQVDVSWFSEGVYHIEVFYKGAHLIRKFIKK